MAFHLVQSQYFAFRDYISPVLKESKFKEHGRITPEEFVAAGDFLTYKFPVWTWEKGEPSKARDYLPAEKQYLLTRGVPCLRRATSLAYTDADEDAEKLLSFADDGSKEGGDEWVQTHAGRAPADHSSAAVDIDDIPDDDDGHHHATSLSKDMSNLNISNGDGRQAPHVSDIPDIDDIPDMEEEGLEEHDDATAAPAVKPATADKKTADESKGNLLQVRTYDVMITYDKYYQTPRIWLLGYDENRSPLTPTQIFQDVSADHAFKTVTIEAFPHSSTLSAASVHPCKHASVMKKVIERMNAHVLEEQQARKGASSAPQAAPAKEKKWRLGGALKKVTGGGSSSSQDKTPTGGDDILEDTDGMRVDFYLVVFLKFIASIVPTIEVDSTTSF
ncbi:E2-like enzyme [Tulasnella sp. 419]|nr:E2-like enzyme [Tulasnella sp. 419]